MRDLLTVLAGLLILVLVAALAVPPFVDWRLHRAYVETAISRTIGTAVSTEGALDIRLLPLPRVRIERLRLGSDAPDQPSLDARFVRSEIALMPLLSGEIRLQDSRVGRAEIKLPAGTAGDWRVPRGLVSEEALRRAFVFEDLSVVQLLLTTVDSRTGRTDQAYAEGVRMQAGALAGPWRVEGTLGGRPFTLVTAELGRDAETSVKVQAGGEGQPRLTLDARLRFAPGPDDTLAPALEGTARLVSPAAGAGTVPYSLSTSFETAGRVAELANVALELGEGTGTLRLAGFGRLALDTPGLALTLEGRRLDLDALVGAGGPALTSRLASLRPPERLPVEATLRLDSLGFGAEEFTAVTARGRLTAYRLVLDGAQASLSGSTQLAASGEIALLAGASATGRVTVKSASGDRLAALFTTFGFGGRLAGALEGRAVDAAADIVLAEPVTSLRNLRIQLGEALLTGALRHTAAEGGGRARLDAQLAIQGLDLTATPLTADLFEPTRALDLGLILDARNVGYGSAERGGRIAARITSGRASLAIERLEIADLAGANATLSGRIDADGAGRIAGRLTARRAAPLADLIGPFWLGGAAALIPTFLRDGAIDLNVTAERAAGSGAAGPALVTRIGGTAGGGTLDAEIVSADGRARTVTANLATDRAGTWVGATLARPARLRLAGAPDSAGRLALDLGGDVAGLRIATTRPFRLTATGDAIEGGEAELATDDLAPLLGALGHRVAGPAPLALRAGLATVAGVPRVTLSGRVAETAVAADLFGRSAGELGGEVSVGRLSLPWLVSSLSLRDSAAPPAGSIWPVARFGSDAPPPFGGAVAVKAESLDLGRGLVGQAARFDLAATPDGVSVRDLDVGLAGGRVTGGFSITRQGSLAALIGEGSVRDIAVTALVGAPFLDGRLTADLRFGGSGESVAAIVSNLGGAGSLQLDGLRVTGADAAGIERAASRALRSDDPLAPARLTALVSEELARAPFAPERFAGPATLVGGAIRVTPLTASAPSGSWQGSAGIDLRTATLDLRGAIVARATPRNWAGAAPYVSLGWSGPLSRPARVLDTGPLANGLASVVLARELERIEIFELDAAERARRNAQVEMDRARRLAAEEAARQLRLREEAELRARLEAERARMDLERARPPNETGSTPVPLQLLPPPAVSRPQPSGG